MDIKKIYGYSYNGYPHKYVYKYETNIYPANRVQENYYSYPTCPVNISR